MDYKKIFKQLKYLKLKNINKSLKVGGTISEQINCKTELEMS